MAVQMHTDTIRLSGPSHTPYSQQPVGVLLASAVTVDDIAYFYGRVGGSDRCKSALVSSGFFDATFHMGGMV